MGLGGGWSRRSRLVSRKLGRGPHGSLGKHLAALSPRSPSQALLFLQTGTAHLFTVSGVSPVCRDCQAQGVTWEVPRKATSQPEIRPLLHKPRLAVRSALSPLAGVVLCYVPDARLETRLPRSCLLSIGRELSRNWKIVWQGKGKGGQFLESLPPVCPALGQAFFKGYLIPSLKPCEVSPSHVSRCRNRGSEW